MRYYNGNIEPDENTIFVFGSNPEGRHGAGSAKVAKEKFGAVYGVGEGLQGIHTHFPPRICVFLALEVYQKATLCAISKNSMI